MVTEQESPDKLNHGAQKNVAIKNKLAVPPRTTRTRSRKSTQKRTELCANQTTSKKMRHDNCTDASCMVCSIKKAEALIHEAAKGLFKLRASLSPVKRKTSPCNKKKVLVIKKANIKHH